MIKLCDTGSGKEMDINSEIALSLLRDLYSMKAGYYLDQIVKARRVVSIHGGILKPN